MGGIQNKDQLGYIDDVECMNCHMPIRIPYLDDTHIQVSIGDDDP